MNGLVFSQRTEHQRAEKLAAKLPQTTRVLRAVFADSARFEVHEPLPLGRWLAERNASRLLVFCDEEAPTDDPAAALAGAGSSWVGIDVLIGPEGGFSEDERATLLKQPQIVRLSLGPRILRADTAAVAALMLVQAALGDGRQA